MSSNPTSVAPGPVLPPNPYLKAARKASEIAVSPARLPKEKDNSMEIDADPSTNVVNAPSNPPPSSSRSQAKKKSPRNERTIMEMWNKASQSATTALTSLGNTRTKASTSGEDNLLRPPNTPVNHTIPATPAENLNSVQVRLSTTRFSTPASTAIDPHYIPCTYHRCGLGNDLHQYSCVRSHEYYNNPHHLHFVPSLQQSN